MLVIALAGAISFAASDTVAPKAEGQRGPREQPAGISAPADDTTPRKRAKAIDVSDGYVLRLSVHRIASYTTLPLFAAQYFSGQALFDADSKGLARPTWAQALHTPLAVGLGGLFAVNSVTGAWNWWETRHDEKGRAWRTVHSALMLVSDAGFAYAASIGGNAKYSFVDRDAHRRWAYASMGVALGSYVMMLGPIRGDR